MASFWWRYIQYKYYPIRVYLWSLKLIKTILNKQRKFFTNNIITTIAPLGRLFVIAQCWDLFLPNTNSGMCHQLLSQFDSCRQPIKHTIVRKPCLHSPNRWNKNSSPSRNQICIQKITHVLWLIARAHIHQHVNGCSIFRRWVCYEQSIR